MLSTGICYLITICNVVSSIVFLFDSFVLTLRELMWIHHAVFVVRSISWQLQQYHYMVWNTYLHRVQLNSIFRCVRGKNQFPIGRGSIVLCVARLIELFILLINLSQNYNRNSLFRYIYTITYIRFNSIQFNVIERYSKCMMMSQTLWPSLWTDVIILIVHNNDKRSFEWCDNNNVNEDDEWSQSQIKLLKLFRKITVEDEMHFFLISIERDCFFFVFVFLIRIFTTTTEKKNACSCRSRVTELRLSDCVVNSNCR